MNILCKNCKTAIYEILKMPARGDVANPRNFKGINGQPDPKLKGSGKCVHCKRKFYILHNDGIQFLASDGFLYPDMGRNNDARFMLKETS